MNCLLWIFYGIPVVHPDSTLVVTINSIGLAMELAYTTIYFIYADKRGRLKVVMWIFIELVFLGIVVACTLLIFHTHTQRSAVVGILCVIFGVLMYTSPLTIMQTFSMDLFGWTYALIRFDVYITIGNGLGAGIWGGAANLVCMGIFVICTTLINIVNDKGVDRVPTFRRIWKRKSVEEFKPDPYIATVQNCLFWILYGIPVVHPDSTLVITINGVGLALELIYLTIFLMYGDNKKRKKIILWLLGELVFTGAMAAITMKAFHTHENRSMFVGILCIIFGVLMYFSPLTIMRKVIKTKSVEYMPLNLSLANFLNGCIWTAYALIKFDLYILISNGLGAISGALQLILYAWYYRSTPKDNDGKPSQVQLSGPNAPTAVSA
ncbi:hypothetical protein L1049_002790 [Liquidambar formosana]|uniref:Bidirectional sugar transporter SWEET n=1 Tax=Liquidambar formosana TaxID=63359 RepID=A0AAP0NGC0_LIQFO